MSVKQIFQGVTTSPSRDFVAECIIKTKPKRIYMPCVGRFAVLESYINHGGEKAEVYTSDISLFSSIIGYIADPSKDIRELNIKLSGIIQPATDEPVDIATATMLTLKHDQINPKNKYGQNIRREIRSNLSFYYEDTKRQIAEFIKAIEGIHYDIRDIWEVIEEAASDEDGFLFVNVPTYKGGYTKMFASENITWDKPSIPEYNPKQFSEMMETLLNSKCKVLAYVQKSLENISEDWSVVFSQPYKIDRTDYIVANYDINRVYAYHKTVSNAPKRFPIYNDEEITEESKISILKVDRDTALYYRDLFVHKLGTTQAEQYYLFLIDSRVVTAFGLALREVLTKKTKYIGEVFGISKSSKRYKRLGKLFMLCLTSGEMKKYLMKQIRFGINEPAGIQTTSITTFEEGKTDRSVMKLVHREQLKTGQFRLIYRADFRNDTFSDCIKHWLQNWGHVRRDKHGRKNA
jgi:hypothetical protein